METDTLITPNIKLIAIRQRKLINGACTCSMSLQNILICVWPSVSYGQKILGNYVRTHHLEEQERNGTYCFLSLDCTNTDNRLLISKCLNFLPNTCHTILVNKIYGPFHFIVYFLGPITERIINVIYCKFEIQTHSLMANDTRSNAHTYCHPHTRTNARTPRNENIVICVEYAGERIAPIKIRINDDLLKTIYSKWWCDQAWASNRRGARGTDR